MNEVICGDFRDHLDLIDSIPNKVIITDPPYNQKYKYDVYKDNLSGSEYVALLAAIPSPRVMIHYPEQTISIFPKIYSYLEEVVAWHYSVRVPKRFRLISWWGIKPDFKRVREPYAEATTKDARNQHKLKDGRAITDVWNIQTVNNMNRSKTAHSCAMPLEVMERIVQTTCKPGDVVVDPFCGSGTTLLAAKKHGFDYLGFDISPQYCKIAENKCLIG